MKNRITAIFLTLALVLGLTACAGGNTAAPAPAAPTPGTAANQGEGDVPAPGVPVEEPEEVRTIRFGCLSGPTGVGAAKLVADAKEGSVSGIDYEVTVATDNSEIAGKLTNGELDIACMASNMAANLYNKTEGAIQALCLSTLGVLYILERGEEGFTTPTVTSMADLKGQTIYATGQGANPEYVLDYLLTANGVDPDKDVEIVWLTAQEVQAAMLTGDAKFAMLPVPAATAVQVQAKAKAADRDVLSALSLTEEWNKVTQDSVLTMTTVVVRREFAEQNPGVVETFLKDYAASIEYVNTNVEEAAVLVEQFGIVPSAAIGKKAIPDCNLVYVDGEAMKDQITGYYEVLHSANPASIGGAVPDAGFYYGVSLS